MPGPFTFSDALLESARLRAERHTLREHIRKLELTRARLRAQRDRFRRRVRNLEQSRDFWRERARAAERAKLPKRLR